MSFAEVEANLIYIQEEDLKPEFQNKLCWFSRTQEPLYILVQLKVSALGSEPMISDLKEIRMDKAKKKIDNWISICFAKPQKLTVKVIDGLPNSSNPYLDFSGVNKLSVYRTPVFGDQILPLVKSHFDKNQLKFLVLGEEE